MDSNRREFIRFVVAGSVVGACPFESFSFGPISLPVVAGELNEVCHRIRDGEKFGAQPISSHYDVCIIGGGISGLASAYYLKDHLKFVLLEKEPHWGGNAYEMTFGEEAYSTGTAYTERGLADDKLASEIGLELVPVNNPDGVSIDGHFAADMWDNGLDNLPYSSAVRRSFRACRDALRRVDAKKGKAELDNKPLSEFLAGYEPEVKQWWDAFCLSDYGSSSENVSAFVVLDDYSDVLRCEPDDRVTLPGGLGAITKGLAEKLLPNHRRQMRTGATVVNIASERGGQRVTYFEDGLLKTLEAKAVIVAAPKFIARHLAKELPTKQLDAMGRIRYAPYAVVNLVFEPPVFTEGYDTWCPGKVFTDFIVANWVARNAGRRQKFHILTCYMPLPFGRRPELLDDKICRALAENVLTDFKGIFPGAPDPVEVVLYRRGHPVFVPGPGVYTHVLPIASKAGDRIFFANTDSLGPLSTSDSAVRAAQHAVRAVRQRLAKGSR